MPSFTMQELQSAIAELDQAIFSHEQWYKSLLRILISRVPAEPADLRPDAHQHCRFGQWYENVSTALLREHPAFVSLGDAHEKMHVYARTLLQLVSDNKLVATSQLDQFENALDKMRLEIQSLRLELSEVIQNQDPLTGAQNRAGLLPWLREQHALSQRRGQHCALTMLDLDHFKRANDEYGHLAGDKVLISTVQCLQTILRPYDRIYRYGGEEFLLCMPGTTPEEAREVAERMCHAVAAQRIQPDGFDNILQVTASLGVAMLDPSRSVEASIESADNAMYRGKKSGRNCVVTEY
jgi:diguanylate cyclase (GGDEF)-like protein